MFLEGRLSFCPGKTTLREHWVDVCRTRVCTCCEGVVLRCSHCFMGEKGKGISMKEAGKHLCTLHLFLGCFSRSITMSKMSLSHLDLGAESGPPCLEKRD